MKYVIVFLFSIILISCNKETSNSITKIENSNIKSIFNKPLNLVFIWTTWCGASKDILRDTYVALQKDSIEYNIILICGNNSEEGIERVFKKLDLNYTKYIIGNASSLHPIMDRRNIKNFIRNKFKNSETLELKGNFGVPVSLLVDSNFNILNSNMPQDTFNIRNEINYQKDLYKK